MKHYVCIDIGGTSIKYSVILENGNIIHQSDMDTKAKQIGGHGILQKIKDIVKNYTKSYDISGVCISTAGMVDPVEGKIIFSIEHLIPNYTGIHIKKEIEDEFNIRCEVENDVNCAGLGEMWLGSGKGFSSAVCITVGTGIGGCIILNNELFVGSSYSSGEIGHMYLDGKSFQDLASTTTLIKNVAKRKNKDITEIIDGKTIFELAKKNDIDCVDEIKKMAKYLSLGIANICYMINPEVIILGGGIMSQEQFLRPIIEKELKNVLVENVYNSTKIEFAKMQNNAGMLGALYNYLQRL